MNLADARSGHATLKAIQRVLLGAAPRRALRDQLQALLSTPARLGPCRLRRTKLKPSHTLTAYYDALVHIDGTDGYCPRAIAVTWGLGGGVDQRHGGATLAEIQSEALLHGVAAPFRELTADRPEWSMHLQVSPLDARFPQLVRLSDPRHVRDMLAGVYAASDGARDQARRGRYAVTAIRYHPGGRHVLRYDPLETAKGGTVFAKLYTGEAGTRAFRAARHAADWLAEHGEGVTAVRPLAYVAEDAVVLYPRVVGAPLSERLHRPGQGLARCLRRAGAALHALHRLPPAATGPLKLHDFAAEVRKATEASDHIRALLPSVGPTIEALLARAGELHERLSQEPPTFTHGDFKSEHVWAASGGSTLIDFDGCRLADPAYDVGRFLADLQLWFIAHDQEGVEQVQGQFLAGYAPSAPQERLLRARLYEAVQLVKIARRVPLFDRDWASLTEQVIRRAQAVMNDLELTLGLPAILPSFHGLLDGRGAWCRLRC